MRVNRLVLILILFLACLLRFIGLQPGYPPIHADEGITHSQGITMILERSLNPQHGYGLPYNYPILVPLINAFFYLFFFIPFNFFWYFALHLREIVVFVQQSGFWDLINIEIYRIFDQQILGLQKINVVFWGRYVTALFGVGVVLLTYLLSEKLFKNKIVGLLSAFFVAINYRQVLNSHLGLPDIYNAFFLLLCLLFVLNLWQKQTLRSYLLAGLGISLYFSTKFQVFGIFPLCLILFFLFVEQITKQRKILDLKRFGNLWRFIKFIFQFVFQKGIILMFLVLIASLLILNVFHILHWQETLEQVGYTALKYRVGRYQIDWYALGYLYQIGIGRLMSILILIGLGLGLIKESKKTLFLLSVALPFMGMMIFYSAAGFYTRNFVTITPVLLIFPAWALWLIFDWLSKKNWFVSTAGLVILLFFLSFESLPNSILVPLEYSQPWNFQILNQWLENNLAEDIVLTIHPSISLPQKIVQSNKVKVIKSLNPGDYFVSELQDQGIDWAIVDIDWVNSGYYWWMQQQGKLARRLWKKPTQVLSNSAIAKMIQELKRYVVFEVLNPWPAPDLNYLVVKVPQRPKTIPLNGQLIYRQNFNDQGDWQVVNDGLGLMTNFVWDQTTGHQQPGSLKIERSSGPSYSQRFVSKLIPVQENRAYQITAWIKASEKLDWSDRDGILGVDFFSSKNEYLSSALASRIFENNAWLKREVLVQLPKETKHLQIFFQIEDFNRGNFWLDDVETREMESSFILFDPSEYSKSKFILEDHLFPNSHGGM